MRQLEEEYGKQKWDLQIFFEEASGADPNRKEFNRLKAGNRSKEDRCGGYHEGCYDCP